MEYIYGPKDTGYKDLYIDISAKEQNLPEIFQEIGRAKGSVNSAVYGYVAIGTNNKYPVFFQYQPYAGIESGRGKYFLHARSLGEGPEYYASRDFYKNFNMLFAKESDIISVAENNAAPRIEYIDKLAACSFNVNAMQEIVYRLLVKRPTVIVIPDEIYNAEGYRHCVNQIFTYLPHSLKRWCSFATGIPNNDYFNLTIIPESLKKKAVEYIDLCDMNATFGPHNDYTYEIAAQIIHFGLSEREALFNYFEIIFNNANYNTSNFADYFNALVKKDEELLKEMILTFIQNEYSKESELLPPPLRTYWTEKYNNDAYLEKIYDFSHRNYEDLIFHAKDFVDSNLAEIRITYLLNSRARDYFVAKLKEIYPKVINQDLTNKFIDKIKNKTYPEKLMPETDFVAEKNAVEIINYYNQNFKANIAKFYNLKLDFKNKFLAEIKAINIKDVDSEAACLTKYVDEAAAMTNELFDFNFLQGLLADVKKERDNQRKAIREKEADEARRQKQLEIDKVKEQNRLKREDEAKDGILERLERADQEFLKDWSISDDFYVLVESMKPANKFMVEEYLVKYLVKYLAGYSNLIHPSKAYDYNKINNKAGLLETIIENGSSCSDIAARFARISLDVAISIIIKYSTDVQTLTGSLLRVIKQNPCGMQNLDNSQFKDLNDYIEENLGNKFNLDDDAKEKLSACLQIAKEHKNKNLITVLGRIEKKLSASSTGKKNKKSTVDSTPQETTSSAPDTPNEALKGFYQIAEYIDKRYYSGKTIEDQYYAALIKHSNEKTAFLAANYLAYYFADKYELANNFTADKIKDLMDSQMFKDMLEKNFKPYSVLSFAFRLAKISVPCAIGMMVRNEEDVNNSLKCIFRLLNVTKLDHFNPNQIKLMVDDIIQNAYRGSELSDEAKMNLKVQLNQAEARQDRNLKLFLEAICTVWYPGAVEQKSKTSKTKALPPVNLGQNKTTPTKAKETPQNIPQVKPQEKPQSKSQEKPQANMPAKTEKAEKVERTPGKNTQYDRHSGLLSLTITLFVMVIVLTIAVVVLSIKLHDATFGIADNSTTESTTTMETGISATSDSSATSTGTTASSSTTAISTTTASSSTTAISTTASSTTTAISTTASSTTTAISTTAATTGSTMA